MGDFIKKYGLVPNQFDDPVIFDVTDPEAVVIRKDNDGGDILVVDTTNGVVAVGGVTPVTGCRLILPQENDAVTPTFAFGAGADGIYQVAEGTLGLAIGGGAIFTFTSAGLQAQNAGGADLGSATSTGVSPAHRFVGDIDTGMGRVGPNQLALITGAIGSYYKNAAGITQRWCTQENVADGGKVTTLPQATNGGIGFALLGDSEEYAIFTYSSAAFVTLIANSGNVGTTEDNDTTFNIYDNGLTVGFNNELGSTKNLFVMVWFN